MSGAVKQVDGIGNLDLQVGRLTGSVDYDPSVTSPEEIMAAIEAAGETVYLED